MYRNLLFLILFLVVAMDCFANNLRISNVSVSAGGTRVDFTISWDNSWRMLAPPANHDAIWIFIKRRDCASVEWHHQDVSPTSGDHNFSSLLMATTVTDKKGIFVHRIAPGIGDVVDINASVLLDNPLPGDLDYQVFGIEMVYVPEGAFQIGDGSNANLTYRPASNALANTPFNINSEASFNISSLNSGASILTYAGSPCGGTSTPLGDSFPKGYNAFYCMKYEVSLGQYVDFLNAANGAAGAPTVAHIGHGYSTPRFGRNPVTGNYPFYTTTTPNRACDSMSWRGLAAYLDWAALSPMTEFEYEKACRGSNPSILNEYAWSTPAYTDINALANDGTPTESSTVLAAGMTNIDHTSGGLLGAYRCGFAASPTSFSRITSGGTYYGIMDMTGNVWERCISPIGTSACSSLSSFNGSHGDGELNGLGNANAFTWPDIATASNTEPFVALKGGAWCSTAAQGRVSDRQLSMDAGKPIGRHSGRGGRGVRRAVTGTSTF